MPRKPTPLADRLWAKVDKSAGEGSCWPFLGICHPKTGYGHLTRDGYHTILAHRAAYMVANDVAFESMPAVVMHTCDNPICCNPAHLKGGTQKQNIADMDAKGRRNGKGREKPGFRGVRNHQSKLDEDAVRYIRRSGESKRDLAARFGVSKSAIGFVRKRATWKHVA